MLEMDLMTETCPMPPEYDPLVKAYRRSKEMPFRVWSEIPHHLEGLGPLEGLDVLDLACGEGFYTRRIRQAGASRVVGIDISPEMIELARQQEAAAPLGIRYEVGSAVSLDESSPFDVVSAAYLLNCAVDRRALAAMAQQIALQLKPGGRLVATIGHMGGQPHVDYRPYGMQTEIATPLTEGAPYQIRFLLEEDSFTITDFHHSLPTYQDALQTVGFEQFEWSSCRVSREGLQKMGAEYWKTWLHFPCIWRLVAKLKAEGG